jgi:cell division septal protein FtsQ
MVKHKVSSKNTSSDKKNKSNSKSRKRNKKTNRKSFSVDMGEGLKVNVSRFKDNMYYHFRLDSKQDKLSLNNDQIKRLFNKDNIVAIHEAKKHIKENMKKKRKHDVSESEEKSSSSSSDNSDSDTDENTSDF